MPTEVDGSRRDVDVHQVVDDPALDVVQDPVHKETQTHVHDLDVGQVPEGRRGTRHVIGRMETAGPGVCGLADLTCPEPRPEAGRTSCNTLSSS